MSLRGYDKFNRALVHKGPYNEDDSLSVNILKDLYSNFAVIDEKNIIVSAHNGVIHFNMFINQECSSDLSLEEGDFYVISKSNEGLVFEYEFHNFSRFSGVFYKRYMNPQLLQLFKSILLHF